MLAYHRHRYKGGCVSEVWVAAEGDDEWSLLEVAPKPHLLRGDTAVQVRTTDDEARSPKFANTFSSGL